MSDPERLSGAYRRPFPEQVAFFRNKLGNLVPTRRWDDIRRDAHDQGFMVAGAMQADLLTDLAAAVDKAIVEGRGLEEFRKDFRAIVKKNGWTGWTGEGSVKGEAWRVRTILRTNAYTSYAAGRYAQLKARGFPLWVYRHGGSAEPRHQHLHEWNGLILPPDHPFWQKAYPPSDWGCSCYVVGARSEAGAIRLGGDPKKKLRDDWDKIDPETGAPAGIGKNWDYAPGASVVDTVRALAEKVRHWDYQIAKAFMAELPAGRADDLARAYRNLPTTADDARRYAQRVAEPKPDLPPLPPVRTLGRVHSEQASKIERESGVDVAAFDFSIAEYDARHVFNSHGDDAVEAKRGHRAVTAADFASLPTLLNRSTPEPAGQSDTGAPVFRFAADIDGKRHTASFELRKGRRTMALRSYWIQR